MANKYEKELNNSSDKYNEKQDTYRNDSELADKNSYMIYELNNTFHDKGKNVLNENVERMIKSSNNSFSSKNSNSNFESKQNNKSHK
ncbi:hypothetical protein [Sedimentibacter sp. B4]|uniref:hypothetical protein n=1 Tax=Sedimentibacter sp. B4 TaxID=304766 RepID=UPI0002FC30D0|nr:hypothetical protein [Sedimentibacter sp. B4]